VDTQLMPADCKTRHAPTKQNAKAQRKNERPNTSFKERHSIEQEGNK
jgi:hypothetical protein